MVRLGYFIFNVDLVDDVDSAVFDKPQHYAEPNGERVLIVNYVNGLSDCFVHVGINLSVVGMEIFSF